MVRSINEPDTPTTTEPVPAPEPAPAAVVTEAGTTEVAGEEIPPTGDPIGEPAQPGQGGAVEPDAEEDEAYTEAELNAMTRAELDEIATENGLDPADYPNKAAVIEALLADED